MRDRLSRQQLPAVLLSVLCVVAVVIVATAATSTLIPAVAFAQNGHWVANVAAGTVAHVDGGTRQVDAQVPLPAEVGEPLLVLQGERQGFIVGKASIAVFGRSSLTVDSSIAVDQTEVPLGIEVIGGPYLVYREAGVIVRLGVPPLSIQAGGRLDRPVWTDDGTVWVRRPDSGALCALRREASALDCSTAAPGEPGALTITAELPAFLATRSDAVQVIETAAPPVVLGADVPDTALVADRDTLGRLALVEPETDRLVLTDSSGVPAGRAGGPALPIPLDPGEYSAPVAADGVIAVLEQTANRLLIFDISGGLLKAVDLPPGSPATITRGGDGRIYVDDADGAKTHVVGSDGSVTSVSTAGASATTVAVAAPPDRRRPVIPPSSGRDPRLPTVALPGTSPPVGGGRQPFPPNGTGGPVVPIPNPRPVGPEPRLVPPTGVVASNRCDGGAVTVSWQPVASPTPVTYTLRGSGGQVLTGPTTSVPVRDLPPGVPVTFTVSASNTAGESGSSLASNVVTPCSQAAAPGSFTAVRTIVGGGNGGFISFAIRTELSWVKPDLGGGELVSYVVTGTQGGVPLRTQTVVSPTATYMPDDFDPCLQVDFQVRAVTREVGGGSGVRLDGAPANHGFQDADCRPIALIRPATLTGDQAVTVEYVAGTETGENTVCTLRFNGVERWTKPCAMESNPEQGSVVIDGLEASTEYSVTLTAVNRYGTTTSDPSIVRTNP